MIPIKAQWHATERVDEDPENPEHAPWRGLGFAYEKRVYGGYVIDIQTDQMHSDVVGKIYTSTKLKFLCEYEGDYKLVILEPNEVVFLKGTIEEYVKLNLNAISGERI